ncbi:hypothetical protein NY08_1827 [Rhodococcus sp. B7740]|nr:hypothetical protein NY08_1827 [Rhodococcus sp. B7740]
MSGTADVVWVAVASPAGDGVFRAASTGGLSTGCTPSILARMRWWSHQGSP